MPAWFLLPLTVAQHCYSFMTLEGFIFLMFPLREVFFNLRSIAAQATALNARLSSLLMHSSR